MQLKVRKNKKVNNYRVTKCQMVDNTEGDNEGSKYNQCTQINTEKLVKTRKKQSPQSRNHWIETSCIVCAHRYRKRECVKVNAKTEAHGRNWNEESAELMLVGKRVVKKCLQRCLQCFLGELAQRWVCSTHMCVHNVWCLHRVAHAAIFARALTADWCWKRVGLGKQQQQ